MKKLVVLLMVAYASTAYGQGPDQSRALLFHNGAALSVSQGVLKEMGLRHGQRLTDDQLREAIRLNAAEFVADMDRRRAAGEQNLPDTTELDRLVKSTKR